MWKVTKENRNFSSAELKVIVLVREIAEFTFATYAEQIIDQIHYQLPTIKRGNNFSADLMYKATQRNLKSIEVWKLDVQGNYKYKMMQLVTANNQNHGNI